MFALVDCNNFYTFCERVFNPNYEPIQITEKSDFVIWGIVPNVIKKV